MRIESWTFVADVRQFYHTSSYKGCMNMIRNSRSQNVTSHVLSTVVTWTKRNMVLTSMTFNELIMFQRSNHPGKAPHGIVQVLHLLGVTPFQNFQQNRIDK